MVSREGTPGRDAWRMSRLPTEVRGAGETRRDAASPSADPRSLRRGAGGGDGQDRRARADGRRWLRSVATLGVRHTQARFGDPGCGTTPPGSTAMATSQAAGPAGGIDATPAAHHVQLTSGSGWKLQGVPASSPPSGGRCSGQAVRTPGRVPEQHRSISLQRPAGACCAQVSRWVRVCRQGKPKSASSLPRWKRRCG